jgi:phosphomevalonate kinase
MIAIRASAPGKLVLLGDYAVLEGAPALAVAVDRRAEARVVPTADGLVRVDAPELGVSAAMAGWGGDGRLRWRCDAAVAARLELVESLCNGLAARDLLPAGQGLRIELDTSGFFDPAGEGRRKLGLGSSAALTVALASALAIAGGHAERVADRARWLGELLALHRAWQGGQGSGVDIAASLAGGMVRYQPGSEGRAPQVEARAWPPAGAACLFLWSGHSVSTAGFLARLAAWRRRDPAGPAARLGELGELARRADAVPAGDAAGFVALVDAYSAALERLAAASGLAIFTPGQQWLARLARAHGAACKPCGAGGDFGMLVAADAERLAQVRRAIIGDCSRPAPLAVDPVGLDLHPPFIPAGPGLRDPRAMDPDRP